MSQGEQHIVLTDIHKTFGAVCALRGVSVRIRRSTVHALVGENGAGKSTLGRVVAGVVRPDKGTVTVNGAPVALSSPRDALAVGITMMAQEMSLIPAMSVAENVFLGREGPGGWRRRRRFVRRRFYELIDRTGFELDPDAPIFTLRLSDQQKVEILRALARDADLIVMDEPTAALGGADSARLLDDVRRLRDAGTTVVYVSHFLKEVLEVADDVTVLKDGTHVRTSAAVEETPNTLVEAMLGRSLESVFPPKPDFDVDASPALSVTGLGKAKGFAEVSFTARPGEIVGIAGLAGSGRSRLARVMAGAERADVGKVQVAGRTLDARGPRDAIKAGIVMLPEDRKRQGLVMSSSLVDNVMLPHHRALQRFGLVEARTQRGLARQVLEGVQIHSQPTAMAGTLSGGNQQKLMFAKWLVRQPHVFIADQPTRGVDMGARETIYRLIHRLARDRMAVVVISDDVEEVLGLAHSVLVMRLGRIVARLDGRTATEAQVTAAALGAGEAAR